MRFSVSWYTANASVVPRWAREFARQLEHGGAQAPSDVLGPVTALHEVRSTAAAVLAGRPTRSVEDRTSLRDDLRRAIDGLGPRVASPAAPTLEPLRRDLGRIPKLLSEANGALAVVALARGTLDELADRALIDAAWDDARAAFEDDAFAGICELRIKQLAELVELRGGDWRSSARQGNRILFDDRLVLASIGAIDPSEIDTDDPDTLNQPAGVPFSKRLDLAQAEIGADPPVGDMIGWVCFKNAALRSLYLDVGGVEFFGHQLWPDAVAAGYPDNAARRDEFGDEQHRFLFLSMPEEPFVLVRVPLGHRRLTGAVERARSIAQDLVRAAQPQSEWSLISGGAIYVRGEDRGWFGAPLDAHERGSRGRFSPEYEPTSARLADLDRALVEKLLAAEPHTHDAVRDLEWAEAVSRVPDAAQRLALSTRLIERALPAPANEHWTEPVSRYFKELWTERETHQLIIDTAEGSVDVLDSIMSPDRLEKSWRRRLLPSRGDGGYTIRLDETLRSITDLIEDLPEGSLQRRVAAELGHQARSADAWLEFWDGHRRTFEILLARLVRQRNAVLHGADTVPAVVASVAEFALDLQGFVIYEQLRAATAGEPLLTALERNRIRLERVRARLEAGSSPAEAIFEDADPGA